MTEYNKRVFLTDCNYPTYILHAAFILLHPCSCGTSRSPFFCNIQNYSCFLIALQNHSDYFWLRPINIIYASKNTFIVPTEAHYYKIMEMLKQL